MKKLQFNKPELARDATIISSSLIATGVTTNLTNVYVGKTALTGALKTTTMVTPQGVTYVLSVVKAHIIFKLLIGAGIIYTGYKLSDLIYNKLKKK